MKQACYRYIIISDMSISPEIKLHTNSSIFTHFLTTLRENRKTMYLISSVIDNYADTNE